MEYFFEVFLPFQDLCNGIIHILKLGLILIQFQVGEFTDQRRVALLQLGTPLLSTIGGLGPRVQPRDSS